MVGIIWWWWWWSWWSWWSWSWCWFWWKQCVFLYIGNGKKTHQEWDDTPKIIGDVYKKNIWGVTKYRQKWGWFFLESIKHRRHVYAKQYVTAKTRRMINQRLTINWLQEWFSYIQNVLNWNILHLSFETYWQFMFHLFKVKCFIDSSMFVVSCFISPL